MQIQIIQEKKLIQKFNTINENEIKIQIFIFILKIKIK